MRKITYLTFTFLIAILLLGCSKDKNNPGPFDDGDVPVPSRGTVNAKIDGRDFVSNYALAFLDNENEVASLAITGSIDTEEAIILHFYDFTGVGTYEIGEDQPSFGMYRIDEEIYGSQEDTEGYLKITSYNNGSVSGTFKFKAVNTVDGSVKNITDGTFSVQSIMID